MRGTPARWSTDEVLCAAAARVLCRVPGDAPVPPAVGPVLDDPSFLELVRGDGGAVGRIARELGLTPFEVELWTVALLPHLDPQLAHQVAVALGTHTTTLGGAVRLLLGEQPLSGSVRSLISGSALWQHGLLQRGVDGGPVFHQPLTAGVGLADMLEGRVPATLGPGSTVLLTEVPKERVQHLGALRGALRDQADDLVSWPAAASRTVVRLSGPKEQARLLGELVAGLRGKPLLHVELPARSGAHWTTAVWIARLLDAVLLLRSDRSLSWDVVPQASDLVLVDLPDEGTLSAAPGVVVRHLRVARTSPEEQRNSWLSALGSTRGVRLNALANQTRLPLDDVHRVATMARLRAEREQAELSHRHVARSLAELDRPPSSALARYDRPVVSWKRLVLPRRPRRQLEDLVRRLQHRTTVQSWGVLGPRVAGRGLIALFHGDSGTGKTLAAEAVCTQLSLPLLTVDLSRVVSKYIGETEKHLAEVFEQADGFRAVLFFDEADALFGKRTDVGDAHDRYANLETSFLLQRLEAFEGLSILASNLPQNMDDAFARRIDFTVFFPRPAPRQRLMLWRVHLPAEHLADDVDLDRMAARYDLVGGEIRQAVLHAAFTSAAQGREHIRAAELERGVEEVLIQRGKTLPASGR